MLWSSLWRRRRLWRRLLFFKPYLGYARSFLRRQRQTLWVWPEGHIELGQSVALFVHYDRDGRLADYVVAYVRALRDSGFPVVFITNAGRRFSDNLATLQALCQAVIVRRNVGYDFGAIREILNQLALPRPNTERLLIANDSVYGPLVPMTDMLARVDFSKADLWSATESWQHSYHLQSYFLVAGRRAMTSAAWQAFWRGVRQVSSKRWVVSRYEIGLTQKLLRAGLRCQALWPYHELIGESTNHPALDEVEARLYDPLEKMRFQAARRIRRAAAELRPMNPTADLWRRLLQAGFPFLKVELLCSNPSQVPDIADWRSMLMRMPSADVETIERDLQIRMRKRAP